MSCGLVAGIIGVLLVSSLGASAAELRLDRRKAEGVFALTGPIAKGDVERFARVLRPYRGNDVAVRLSSSGGDQEEGWRLAQLFRDLHVATVVPAGATCAGACALAFLGGTGNGIENQPAMARTVLPGGMLRFQSPFPRLTEGIYSGERAARAHADAVRMVALFLKNVSDHGFSEKIALEIVQLQGTAYRELAADERSRMNIGAGPDIFPERN